MTDAGESRWKIVCVNWGNRSETAPKAIVYFAHPTKGALAERHFDFWEDAVELVSRYATGNRCWCGAPVGVNPEKRLIDCLADVTHDWRGKDLHALDRRQGATADA